MYAIDQGGFQIRFNPFILAEQILTAAKCAGLSPKDKPGATVMLAFKDDRKPENYPVQIWAQSEGGQIEVTGIAMPLAAE